MSPCRAYLLAAWIGLAGAAACLPAPAWATQAIHVVSHRNGVSPRASLSSSQRAWLAGHNYVIRVGMVPGAIGPLDLVDVAGDYEGISAEYLGMLASAWHANIEVSAWPNRAELMNALAQGKIDLVTSAQQGNGERNLAYSAPYFGNKLAVATRIDNALYSISRPTGQQVLAYVPGTVDEAELRKSYGDMRLAPYPSIQSTLEAVAFGRADSCIGNATALNYLIEQHQLLNVKVTDFAVFDMDDFRFASTADNAVLVQMVDDILRQVPVTARAGIRTRWEGLGMHYGLNGKVALTASEQLWITEHRTVRYAVTDDLPPFAFRTGRDSVVGLSIDLLNVIGARTGLQFEPVLVKTGASSAADIPADMLAAAPGTAPQGWLSAAPYSTTPEVIIASADRNYAGLPSLRGRRVALSPGAFTTAAALEAGGATAVEADAVWAAADLVASGKAEAMLTNITTANYIINQQFRTTLKIVGETAGTSAAVAFAVRPDDEQLVAILNKGLASIPVPQMDALRQQWQFAGHAASRWDQRRPEILAFVLGIIVLAVLFLIWNYLLRKQIRRRRRAEAQLEDRLAFQRTLLSSLPFPISAWDVDGRLLDCNDAFVSAHQSIRADLIGRRVDEIDHVDERDAQWFEQVRQDVMRNGQPAFFERTWHVSGRTVDAHMWLAPFYEHTGPLAGTLRGWIDVSEQAQLKRDLQTAKQSAEDANRAKSTFLATMSHEIRTPMNAVLGVLELLKEARGSIDAQHASIDAAYDSARGLLSLIDDILDLSKIESGKLELDCEPTDCNALINSVGDIFSGLARQRHIGFSVSVDNAHQVGALVDPLRLRQILSNLLSNAVKFTETGEVSLHATITPENDDRVRIHIQVSDTGIGMTAEQQTRLFQPFTQASPSIGSRFGGSGLGLSICRHLAELMGGTLALMSSPGVGTIVRMTLHAPRAVIVTHEDSHVEPVSQLRDTFAACTALIVDDHPANRFVLERQLEYLGFRVVCAQSAIEAIEHWQRTDFDMIITDCFMPGMTGYELAQHIRAEETTLERERAVIVGYTANVQPNMLRLGADAGMDVCLAKPLGLGVLSAKIAPLLNVTGIQIPLASPDHGHASFDGLADPAAIEQIVAGDAGLEITFLNTITQANRDDLAQLHQTIAVDDRSRFVAILHHIRSAIRLIGAHAVEMACADAEQRAMDGEESLQTLALLVSEHVQRLNHVLDARVAQLATRASSEPA
ncbi:Virulence sensor protein BvgS [Paraburkholderia domus]|uniref:Virulence sensor protein BvgS n=1 Tax=Paraburkholderia domus TaxID=2793075 RepID=A0A9N8R6V8_9BURK|nr:transporter substrate-binding domain-containing protein [Paraburkholderia domus]MBK5063501.1 transporter substrate-binding domain-containing protein [Burkholderia sp. R-70199]MBK5088508.1 transporter substrate-binding domain-containing protein [Burkholderia sp. R-69927]MBK5123678.1 transporter substrate-binding domain-containing protein [Burkholderia sp. R-69980]MBK5169132.1 transporter substrate-binding domain-containing protein [Burkholderia sp. R-70211]MBK5183601.1 transporter substrate-